MKTILAPVDFSPITEHVLAEAIELAQANNARLVLLHVTEPDVGVVDYTVVALTIARADETTIRNALARLSALETQLKLRHVTVETRHCLGSAAEEILREAKDLAADYLVIGSHGHGMIYDVLVGSTTNSILKHAPCPVLVVPATATLRGATAPGEFEVTI